MEPIFKVTGREKGIRNTYFLAFILLFICFFVTLYANRELLKQSERVEHTNDVITSLDNGFGKVVDGETGMRGYLLSGDLDFLDPYSGSKKGSDSFLNKARRLLDNNKVQILRLNKLDSLIKKKFNIIAFNLRKFQEEGRQITDSILQIQLVGKNVMDSIRKITALMEDEERQSLVGKERKLKNLTAAITIITIISLGLVCSLLIFGFMTYMQVSKQRKEAEHGIWEFQQELKKRIGDLDEANGELIKMRSQEKFAVTGRIARTIGHEVRNPLTNIMLAVDQLKNDIGDKSKDNSYLFKMIERNSARINQLISDLLDSTKVAELNYERISLSNLLTETLADAKDRIALTNVKLTTRLNQDSGYFVAVDKQKMKIALLNIITNAVEAMYGRPGSELEIGVHHESNRCEISIKDNGPGMDSETLAKIFEPYYTTKKTGNGLGLTNTQNIILNHKGDVTVLSQPGEGTVFKIALKRLDTKV